MSIKDMNDMYVSILRSYDLLRSAQSICQAWKVRTCTCIWASFYRTTQRNNNLFTFQDEYMKTKFLMVYRSWFQANDEPADDVWSHV